MQDSGTRMSKALTELQENDIRDTEHDLTDLLELRDIEDELSTVKKLFKDQLRVIDQLIVQCFTVRPRSEKGLEHLKNAYENVKQYHEQVQEMLDDCRSVQESACPT